MAPLVSRRTLLEQFEGAEVNALVFADSASCWNNSNNSSLKWTSRSP